MKGLHISIFTLILATCFALAAQGATAQQQAGAPNTALQVPPQAAPNTSPPGAQGAPSAPGAPGAPAAPAVQITLPAPPPALPAPAGSDKSAAAASVSSDSAAPAATPARKPSLTEPLAGRRICIDPGHGGDESGAVGRGGLREKDINLQVSHYLREMLEKAGATVVMTRTDDTSVGILARGKFNKAQNTDLFVSVHHNANAQGDDSMNRSESFWHWHDDGGPSEDGARLLAREFRANTGYPGKAYLCWAYGVLRENAYPAFLGEMSYLQNPDEEKRLRDPEYLRREAGCYFRAIESLFKGGRPEVRLIIPPDPNARRVVHAFVLQRDGLSLLDPAWVRLELDGAPLDHDVFYRREDFAVVFARLPEKDLSGTHTLTLAARNLAGHSSTVVHRPMFFTDPWQPPAPPHQARFGDAAILGKSSPSATPVPIPGAELFGQQIRDVYALANDKGVVKLDAVERVTPEPHIARAPGYVAREADLAQSREITLTPLFQGALIGKKIVIDPAGGGDDPGAYAEHGLRAADVNLNAAIYLADYLRRAGATVWLTRTRDEAKDNVARVRFGLEREPDVFVTINHRLAEPGMKEKPKQNVTRGGARWDDGNEIARRMAFHLRQLLGTGAELGDPSSRKALPGEVANWSSWEAMHGDQAYTAMYISPIQFDAPGAEDRLATTAATRKEALGILYGLLDWFGQDARKLAWIEGRVAAEDTGAPVGDALVWLDDTILVQTESDGKFLLKYLDEGEHTLRVMALGRQPATLKYTTKNGAAQSVEVRLARLVPETK